MRQSSPPPVIWKSIQVSAKSQFADHLWELDIRTPGRRGSANKVDWSFVAPIATRISAIEFQELKEACKQFLWSMTVYPPQGRKRVSQSTVHARSSHLRVMIEWMATEGITRFAHIDAPAIEKLRGWLRTRSNTQNKPITPNTIAIYMTIVKDLYRQRTKLVDGILIDPLPDETPAEAAGLTNATQGTIPFIPDDIAIAILSEALRWVEEHGETILSADRIRVEARSRAQHCRDPGKPSRLARRALAEAGLVDPAGRLISGERPLQRALNHLVEACYLIIAGFVGMRVSEILSLQAGAIETRPIGETGVNQAYVIGRLYKAVDHPDGRIERWIAPFPVTRAVGILEYISEPLRILSNRGDLFLIKNHTQEVVVLTPAYIGWRINNFASAACLPLHEGKSWTFSTHQFRKTFARFIARHDRTQLLGLANHYKHASLAMTSRGYVGTDFDLSELIDEESRAETEVALERLLLSDRLAGKMGERIVAGNGQFRGRAGEQIRRDYVKFIMTETDLRIYACDYGWCVFQHETARCEGIAKPNEAKRAPDLCLSCNNMVIEDRHSSYWGDRRMRNEALLPNASPMLAAVLNEAIEQCDRVLSRIGS